MLKKLLVSYMKLFDTTIDNSTLIVGIISIMIFWVGLLSNTNAQTQSNIFQYKNAWENIIVIDGKKYKLTLEEVK